MEWRHSGSPRPKNSECKNPLEEFWPRLFGIKRASSTLIIFQRAKLSTRSITHLCWCNWRTFWRKNAAGSSPRGLVLAQQCPGSPGTCNPKETGPPDQSEWVTSCDHRPTPPATDLTHHWSEVPMFCTNACLTTNTLSMGHGSDYDSLLPVWNIEVCE